MKLRPNHHNGVPVPFTTLMDLERINDLVFRSTTAAFSPGAPLTEHIRPPHRAYGGHVYAQSVLAASKTIPPGYTVNVRH